jgi:AcrR family transcriptional regulator
LPKESLRQRPRIAKKKRRPRRSTEEVVDLIIEAARDEFERNGYEGAKTVAIAQKAQVAEALIFSNFGSKAKLFHDSIFKPLNQHFVQFSATHLVDADDAEGAKEWTRQYICELQQFIGRHSRMLRTVIAAQLYESEDVQGLSQVEGLHEFFSLTSAKSMKRFADKPKIDPRLLARVSFATILTCVIFKDWLFPEGLASGEEVSAAITDFILEGVGANAATPIKARLKARRSGRVVSELVSPSARRRLPSRDGG